MVHKQTNKRTNTLHCTSGGQHSHNLHLMILFGLKKRRIIRDSKRILSWEGVCVWGGGGEIHGVIPLLLRGLGIPPSETVNRIQHIQSGGKHVFVINFVWREEAMYYIKVCLLSVYTYFPGGQAHGQ